MDIEITPSLLSRIQPQFDNWHLNFQYDYSLTEVAQQNKNITPKVVPVIWDFIFTESIILTVEQACVVADWIMPVDKRDLQFHIKARMQNFLCGMMRELDLCYKLLDVAPKCRLYKNYSDDIRRNVDLWCSLGKKDIPISVCHHGSASKRYKEMKKSKSPKNLVELWAKYDKRNKGLHVINDKDVDKFAKTYL